MYFVLVNIERFDINKNIGHTCTCWCSDPRVCKRSRTVWKWVMLSWSEEVFEVVRWLFVVLLTAQWAGSVESVQQFTIHRMQHIDIGSTSFGASLHATSRQKSAFPITRTQTLLFVLH